MDPLPHFGPGANRGAPGNAYVPMSQGAVSRGVQLDLFQMGYVDKDRWPPRSVISTPGSAPVRLMQTEFPILDLGPDSDSQRDERATRLSYICVDQFDAVVISAVVCYTLGLSPVGLGIDDPDQRTIMDIGEEARADFLVLEYMAEGSPDGEYLQARNGSLAYIVFDGVLVDEGDRIPVQLLVHELAHHVEWYLLDGQFSGHGDAFTTGIREVTDVVWHYLELDSWTDRLWSEIVQLSQQAVTAGSEYQNRYEVYAVKWKRLLTRTGWLP